VALGDGVLWEPSYGLPLVFSDGTAAGTRRLGDLAPGIAGEPSLAVVDDAQAFFTEAGSLWRTDSTPAGVLCLLGHRCAVSAWWRDPRSGDFGRARAEPLPGNDLSGTFWFFRDGNVELLVKALDGTPVNRRWWIFAGGLTDVEYWLQALDVEAAGAGGADAVKWYHHPPPDLCGLADTDAFAGLPGGYFPSPAAGVAAAAAPTSLDLLGGRYRVSVDWRDPRSGDVGVGHAVPGSDNTGFFWFFRDSNVELVVKVLDGTPVNGHRWVFYGGLTDVEYTLRVEDLLGDEVRTYDHPAGDLCGGADTTAFPEPTPPTSSP